VATVPANYRWLERAAIDLSKRLMAGKPGTATDALEILLQHAPKRGGKTPDSWSARMCEAWEKRFGAGSSRAFAGQLCRLVKPLIELHGETAILIAWARFIESEPSPWPMGFATRFGKYLTKVTPAGAPEPTVDIFALPCDPLAEAGWARALGILELGIPRHNFATWFRPTRGAEVVSIDNPRGLVLHVLVPNRTFKEQLAKVYGPRICGAIRSAGYIGVEFKVPA
jgi:hypothetical protein